MSRTLVIIPTYREATTITRAVTGVRAVADVDVLIVDDASPDGTGQIAEQLAAQDPAVHVLHRSAKDGLGRAYVEGFRWALGRDYALVGEMDADGSHRPEDLPVLLARAARSDAPDLVIGSRWVPGGKVENWPTSRKVLSRGGNTWVHLAMGLPVADATGGFRLFRREILQRLPLDEVQSQGYCFQVDMTARVLAAGGTVAEVPIVFVERTEGESKMSRQIVAEALLRTTGWGLRHRAGQVRALLTRR